MNYNGEQREIKRERNKAGTNKKTDRPRDADRHYQKSITVPHRLTGVQL